MGGQVVWQQFPDTGNDGGTLFPRIGAAFAEAGGIRTGDVGAAPCQFMRHKPLVDFATAWQQWTTLGTGQPKIWVGLPAAKNAADASGFVSGANLSKIVASVGKDALFGGLMFWDAGYDADNLAAGSKARRWVSSASQRVISAAVTWKFATGS